VLVENTQPNMFVVCVYDYRPTQTGLFTTTNTVFYLMASITSNMSGLTPLDTLTILKTFISAHPKHNRL